MVSFKIKNNSLKMLNVQNKNVEVLQAQIAAYKSCFEDACTNVDKLDTSLSQYFGAASIIIPDESKIRI